MTNSKTEDFWLENISDLFGNTQIIPSSENSPQTKVNCISRLTFLIFVLLIVCNCNYSMIFLNISLLLIVALFYQNKLQENKQIDKINMNTVVENYSRDMRGNLTSTKPYIGMIQKPVLMGGTHKSGLNVSYSIPNTKLYATEKVHKQNGQLFSDVSFETPQSTAFCNDTIDATSYTATTMNQNLTGNRANPKTLIAPIVSAPTHALDYWADNNMITMSQINSQGVQQDMYLSGYAESTCCGYINDGTELVPENKENYNGIVAPTPSQPRVMLPNLPVSEGYNGIVAPTPSQPRVMLPNLPVREGYHGIVAPTPSQPRVMLPNLNSSTQLPSSSMFEGYNGKIVLPNKDGMVNTDCGYNPENLQHNIPSNLLMGDCQSNKEFDSYNKNIFTSIVTPGVYTQTQVNEPLNSNIGISFQQQFEPVKKFRDETGLHYIQKDPRIVSEDDEDLDDYKCGVETTKASYDNVYDPRFYGYGTSYRSYIDKVTGQPRFYYDDINAIKMPNYITRSKIDHLPFADSYGPVKEGESFGNIHNPNIRALAQDSWLRDSTDFRNDIMERTMRKINAIAWQKKIAPHGPNQLVHRGGK